MEKNPDLCPHRAQVERSEANAERRRITSLMGRNRYTSERELSLIEALMASADRWRYGYDLMKEIGLKSGTLYPILIRLSAGAGWRRIGRQHPSQVSRRDISIV